MAARAILFAILFTAAWRALEYVVGAYGAIILAAILASVAIYLFGRLVGPKLPVFLGGDPPPPQPPVPDREWDLYIAMLTNDLGQAKRCLVLGADPRKPFAATRRPSATAAATCYEHALHSGQEDMIALFQQTAGPASGTLSNQDSLRGET